MRTGSSELGDWLDEQAGRRDRRAGDGAAFAAARSGCWRPRGLNPELVGTMESSRAVRHGLARPARRHVGPLRIVKADIVQATITFASIVRGR
jgi:hypothetical protein